MAEEIKEKKEITEKAAGEVNITATDVLKNEELMKQILNSDTIKTLIQSETDRVRTKAAQEKQTTLAELETKIAELTEFQKQSIKMQALKKTGLDIELWDFVNGENEEEILKNAQALNIKLQKIAESKVGAPVSTSSTFIGVTKEQFGKMSYAEKAQLFQKDKELYYKLSKGE